MSQQPVATKQAQIQDDDDATTRQPAITVGKDVLKKYKGDLRLPLKYKAVDFLIWLNSEVPRGYVTLPDMAQRIHGLKQRPAHDSKKVLELRRSKSAIDKLMRKKHSKCIVAIKGSIAASTELEGVANIVYPRWRASTDPQDITEKVLTNDNKGLLRAAKKTNATLALIPRVQLTPAAKAMLTATKLVAADIIASELKLLPAYFVSASKPDKVNDQDKSEAGQSSNYEDDK